MTLDELCGQRVVLWGLGAEGLAMARLLRDRHVEARFVDDHPEGASERLESQLGGTSKVMGPAEADWSSVDVVVRAPGVGRYRPELEAARAAGVTVTTAMALWLEDFAGARVVAVTGTKGKSTTAALTAAILARDGRTVDLIGNIGVPVVEMYGRPPADAYVVEVSSYQAADVEVSPGVVVLTSLAPDHLDWHRDEETYYRDKLRLADAGPPGELAVNAGSQEAVRRTADHPRRTLFGPTGRVSVDGSGGVSVDGVRVADAALLRLAGVHNRWNLCGAVTGATLLDGRPPTPATLEAVLTGFEGLPSRCQVVGERDGLTFVDDALASNPYATSASVAAFPDGELTVILGGADRGVDLRPLAEALADRRPAPGIVLVPPDVDRLADALASVGIGDPVRADDLDGAVDAAVSMTRRGGVVMFSPAAPTPEGQGGYRERSSRFRAAARLGPVPR